MKRCGLLGEHLGHSYSPAIHAELADYAYELYEVAPEKLGEFLQSGRFDGLNVTEVKILETPNGFSRGFGFVTFASEADADKALEKNNGRRKAAAEQLGISERTLYRKIKEYKLED